MKYSAIIFDLDGTIVDSEHIWKRATVCMLESKGIQLTKEIKSHLREKLHGIGIIESGKFIKNYFNLKESPQELVDAQDVFALKFYQEEIKFIDGFLPFYKKLEKLHIKKGIATNANAKTVTLTNNKFNLKKYFGSHIYCVDDVNNVCKPEPDVYLLAAKKLEVNPQKCIAIEDSMLGIQAAKKAGMFCIGINTGKNRSVLSQADCIVDTYGEIDIKNIFI